MAKFPVRTRRGSVPVEYVVVAALLGATVSVSVLFPDALADMLMTSGDNMGRGHGDLARATGGVPFNAPRPPVGHPNGGGTDGVADPGDEDPSEPWSEDPWSGGGDDGAPGEDEDEDDGSGTGGGTTPPTGGTDGGDNSDVGGTPRNPSDGSGQSHGASGGPGDGTSGGDDGGDGSPDGWGEDPWGGEGDDGSGGSTDPDGSGTPDGDGTGTGGTGGNPGDGTDGEPQYIEPPGYPAGGDGGDGDGDSEGGGHNNNGHGNNHDTVDVSNPGGGNGGPTGAVDPSGTFDDEIRGPESLPATSGAAPPPATLPAGSIATILLTLSDPGIPRWVAAALIEYLVDQLTGGATAPKILVVLDDYHHGEDVQDVPFIIGLMEEAGIEVSYMGEPSNGLQMTDVTGFDLVWFSNPGWPTDDKGSLQTLTAASDAGIAVVLQGDDMTFTHANGNGTTLLENLTGADHVANGTWTDGQQTDNNDGSSYTVQFGTDGSVIEGLEGVTFTYGNDIDHSIISAGDAQVLAWAWVQGVGGLPGATVVPVVIINPNN